MAIYHCQMQKLTRNKGKSAVAASAYRSGEKLTNKYDGITHNYTNRKDIPYSEIILPPNAPPQFQNRATLWNEVEKKEKSKNAVLAREFNIALPIELTLEQQITLIRDYTKSVFVNDGMCADISIHDKNDGNPHAHIMLTCRPLSSEENKGDGIWGDKEKKNRLKDKDGNYIYDNATKKYKCGKSIKLTKWDSFDFVPMCRERWAYFANEALKKAGHDERISHESLAAQGITDRKPQKHLGAKATAMERRGEATEIGNYNRFIEAEYHETLLRNISELEKVVQNEKSETEHQLEPNAKPETTSTTIPQEFQSTPITPPVAPSSEAKQKSSPRPKQEPSPQSTPKPQPQSKPQNNQSNNNNTTPAKVAKEFITHNTASKESKLSKVADDIKHLYVVEEKIRSILYGKKNKHGWVDHDDSIDSIRLQLKQTWNLITVIRLNNRLEEKRTALKKLFDELKTVHNIPSKRQESLYAVVEEAEKMYGEYGNGKINTKINALRKEAQDLMGERDKLNESNKRNKHGSDTTKSTPMVGSIQTKTVESIQTIENTQTMQKPEPKRKPTYEELKVRARERAEQRRLNALSEKENSETLERTRRKRDDDAR